MMFGIEKNAATMLAELLKAKALLKGDSFSPI
jgi:hypothetical protein